jgi:hypothetical protein
MDQFDQALGDWKGIASERRIRKARGRSEARGADASFRSPRQRLRIARFDRRAQESRIGWIWEKVGAGAHETVEQRRVSGAWVMERRWKR